MRNIVAVVLILILASVAHAGDIFQYVDSYGVTSFTDDEKRIPAAYKDAAEKIVLEDAFQDMVTVVTATPEIGTPSVEEGSEFVEPCTGAVTVTSERRQFGDFNRTVYLVHDECGNLVSETFSQPEVRINR